MTDLLGEHEVGVVVAALAAVLLGVGEAEEAELTHAPEDPVREGRLLPFLGVWGELLLDERPDRLAQPLVLLGKDEVLARRAEIRLDDGGVAMSVWTATPIARPPEFEWVISSARTMLA